jgi:hypothetical protein
VPKTIRFDDGVQAEFLDAIRWYAKRSPATAEPFRFAVEDTIARLSEGSTVSHV